MLWSSVLQQIRPLVDAPATTGSGDDSGSGGDSDPGRDLIFKLCDRLNYTDDWTCMQPNSGRPPPQWGATFVSADVLLTRNELLTLMRTKLLMRATWANIVRLATKITWECFGSIILDCHAVPGKRKVVGISKLTPGRRDFVSISGSENNTALGAEVIMFVRISGCYAARVNIPVHLRLPVTNYDSTTMALVRWLAPHPQAFLRDSKRRPVCPPPFGTNHALWTYAKGRRRGYFRDNLFRRQLLLFPGHDNESRRAHAETVSHAMYDFVNIECIDQYMNCTPIDNDVSTILQTITLPFE